MRPAALTATPGVSTSPDPEALKAVARTVLGNVGIDYGPNRINRLVVTFAKRVQRNGFSFFDFLANSVQLDEQQRRAALADPAVARVISYADPTGEQAAANVDREREARRAR